jgi:hypothetical protein
MTCRWFGRALWVGIVGNLAFAIPLLVAPDTMLARIGLPAASPATWVRLSALLSATVSVFYVPAALDPDRYRAVAWLAVASRLAGAVFFFFQSPEFRVFGWFDLVFFILLAVLLRRDGEKGSQRH